MVAITTSSASRARVAFIAETAYATTPATPAFQGLRRAIGGMKTSKETQPIETAANTLNVAEVLQVGQTCGGQYNFELTYGTFDTFLQAVLGGTWSSNVLTEGVNDRSFTVEETVYLSPSGTTYRRFAGAKISSLSLDFSAISKVTGNVAFVAVEETLDTAILSGATYTDGNSNRLEASRSAASISTPGFSATPAIIRLMLDFDNNLEAIRTAQYPLFTYHYRVNKVAIGGAMDLYFQTNDAYQKVLDHSSTAITFTIGSTTTKKYTFAVNSAQLVDAETVFNDRNGPLVVRIKFRALKGTSSAITVTRAVA